MHRSILLVLLLAGGGCRSFDRYAIELRDAETEQPVQGATITTRYDFMSEMMRPLAWGKPKSFESTTDADGWAEIRVEPSRSWWFEIEVEGRPAHSLHFSSDGALNEPIARAEPGGDWIAVRAFANEEAGSLEASVRLVKKAE